jgi:peptidoglycan/xylan/chitin deacetylase (PgdA/CDA1 family)/heat shock protein HslJ
MVRFRASRAPVGGAIALKSRIELVAAYLLVMAMVAAPPVAAQAPLANAIHRFRSTSNTIALTFDDGWDAGRCMAIYHTLIRFGVPATWFPNGVYVRTAPTTWRTIAARFPLGNHTLHHKSLPTLDDAAVRREILRNERTIEEITGRPLSKLLRPPYGAIADRVRQSAADLGYHIVLMWSKSDGDTRPDVTAREAAQAALQGKSGAIILMHCGPAVTPQILPVVIARYACRGFRFATVEGLLGGRPGVRARVHCPPPPLPAAPVVHQATTTHRSRTHSPTPSSPPDRPDPIPAPSPPVAPTQTVELVGDWRLTDIASPDGSGLVPETDDVTMHFDRAMASGDVGCDRIAMPFVANATGGVSFGSAQRTWETCASPEIASSVLARLADVAGYRLDGETLELTDGAQTVLLRLVADVSHDLVGRWVVTGIADGSGVASVPVGSSPTIWFGPNGIVRGRDGCVRYQGGYSTTIEKIAIGPLLAGTSSCPQPILDQDIELLRALRGAVTWSVTDQILQLRDPEGVTLVEAAVLAPHFD